MLILQAINNPALHSNPAAHSQPHHLANDCSHITILLNRWADHKGYDISSDDGILAVRDEFIAEHRVELYDLVYTLCNKHHVSLHGVYGKAPAFGSEDRQKNWIEKQKAKAEGKTPIRDSLSLFGKFL